MQPSVLWHCWLGGRKGIQPVKKWGDGGGWHCLVRLEWCPARWSVCLPLLIFPCTIKSRSSLLAMAHPGGPGKRAVKRLWWWWCGGVCNALLYNTYNKVIFLGHIAVLHRCSLLLQMKYCGQSVCHSREPCKNGWTYWDAIWCVDVGGTKEPCIRWGLGAPCRLRGVMRPWFIFWFWCYIYIYYLLVYLASHSLILIEWWWLPNLSILRNSTHSKTHISGMCQLAGHSWKILHSVLPCRLIRQSWQSYCNWFYQGNPFLPPTVIFVSLILY